MVSVGEGEIVVKGGHRPRPSFLKGGTQARDPFVNSVSLCSNSISHAINLHMRHAIYVQEHDAYVELIVEAKQAGTDRSKKNRENKYKKREKRMTRTTPPVGTPVLVGPVSQSLCCQTFKVVSSSYQS